MFCFVFFKGAPVILTVGQVEARVEESSRKEPLVEQEPGGWSRQVAERTGKCKKQED